MGYEIRGEAATDVLADAGKHSRRQASQGGILTGAEPAHLAASTGRIDTLGGTLETGRNADPVPLFNIARVLSCLNNLPGQLMPGNTGKRGEWRSGGGIFQENQVKIGAAEAAHVGFYFHPLRRREFRFRDLGHANGRKRTLIVKLLTDGAENFQRDELGDGNGKQHSFHGSTSMVPEGRSDHFQKPALGVNMVNASV